MPKPKSNFDTVQFALAMVIVAICAPGLIWWAHQLWRLLP